MKRNLFRAAALVLCTAAALTLTACGGDASSAASSAASSQTEVLSSFGSYTNYDYENFYYSMGQEANGYWTGVTATDVVTLPEDFAAISIPAADVTPTDADVAAALEQLRASTSTAVQVTDRAAVNGDTVNIDYLGKVDGVAFMGGEAKGFDLTLGSSAFIGDFEEQLVGHTPGETFDITVTFPEGYRDSTDAEGNTIVMSGTEAVFTITMNHISETVLPEVTDEWVQANMTEYYAITKASEVDKALRDELLFNNKANFIYSYLMQNTTFGEIPEVIVNYEVCACLDYYNVYAGYYSMTLIDFVQQQIGLETIDQLLAESEEGILAYCEEDLLYQALAEQLGTTVTAEDLVPYEEYVTYYGDNYVYRQVLLENVMKTLVENAVVA